MTLILQTLKRKKNISRGGTTDNSDTGRTQTKKVQENYKLKSLTNQV